MKIMIELFVNFIENWRYLKVLFAQSLFFAYTGAAILNCERRGKICRIDIAKLQPTLVNLSYPNIDIYRLKQHPTG